MSQPAYVDIARRKQEERASRIPKAWILKNPPSDSTLNVLDVPRKSGLLSARELEITEAYDAVGLVEALRIEKYSALEVTKAFCKRAAIAQQVTNCLTEIFFEEAIARAKFLDRHFVTTGEPIGPLHGLPISLKDTQLVPGYDASIGYASFCFKPVKVEECSPLVKMLLDAGAVLYVKTNIPQTLAALDSMNHVFGRTLNPLNRKLTAGGSTGGEGALIAMRGSLLGVGSDVGGSIRVPAACNGLYGLKPSAQRLYPEIGQRGGGMPGAAEPGVRVSIGPLATSVRACELFMKVVLDQSPWDVDPAVVYSPWRTLPSSSTKMTFGILPSDLVTTPLPPIKKLMEETAEQLTRAGHKVIILDNPPKLLAKAQSLVNAILGIEGSNSSFDIMEATGEPLTPWVSTRMKRKPHKKLAELFALNVRRQELALDLLKIWKHEGTIVDALIMPVYPHPTSRIDEFNAAGYTSMWNLLDWPAGVVPARAVTKEDLKGKVSTAEPISNWDKANRKLWDNSEDYLDTPMSLQIIGKKLQEEALMKAMAVVDEVINGQALQATNSKL